MRKHNDHSGRITASTSGVVLLSDTVVKYQTAARTRIELAKTQCGAAIGRATSLFATPRIISYDTNAGSITFERLHGLCSLKQALSSSPSPRRLIERVARSLAAIHNDLVLAGDYAVPLPDFGVTLRARSVFVHGDFSTTNIFFAAQHDEMFVIDWSTPAWLAAGVGSVGPCYLDLGILLQSLFDSRPFGPYPIRDPAGLGRTFLDVYCAEASNEVYLEEFHRYFELLLSAFLRIRAREMPNWRFVAYTPSFWRVHRFVRRISAE